MCQLHLNPVEQNYVRNLSSPEACLMASYVLDLFCSATCGLYYNPIMIVNDDARVINKLETHLLMLLVVIYDRYMFIIQATGELTLKANPQLACSLSTSLLDHFNFSLLSFETSNFH